MCRGRGRAFYYIYIYSGKRKSGEGAELVGVLVAKTIHPACVCEGGERGGDMMLFIGTQFSNLYT